MVDLVFEAVAECWQGRVKPKLMIKDILRRCDDDARCSAVGVASADQGVSVVQALADTLPADPATCAPSSSSRDRDLPVPALSLIHI